MQRVSRASVGVDSQTVGEIGSGLLVLVGVARGDSEADALYLARKVAALRIFQDDAGKMNLSVVEVAGAVLAVSQFTLCADTRKGNRPSFTSAAPPDEAAQLYEAFARRLETFNVPVRRGVFGAHMHVELLNDGPVTIIIDSSDRGVSGK